MAETVILEEGTYITLFDLGTEHEETYMVQRITKHPSNDGSANIELAQKFKPPKMLHIRARR